MRRIARTDFCAVIAGLDPAIHAEGKLARWAFQNCNSAWTTGSSPVVTKEGKCAPSPASFAPLARPPSPRWGGGKKEREDSFPSFRGAGFCPRARNP
jgi:hypothetical protein